MLHSVFNRPRCLRRFASYNRNDRKILDDYCARLIRQGYSPNSIQLYVRCVEHLIIWLRKSRMQGLSEIRHCDFTAFQSDHLRRCKCPRPAAKHVTSVRAALVHLQDCIDGSRGDRSTLRAPRTRILEDYIRHLENVSGLAKATCVARKRYAMEFISHCFGSEQLRWCKIKNEQVINFVTSYGERCSAATAGAAAINLRSFLRFLQMNGMIKSSLIAAVPHVAYWRLANVPQVMNEEQIKQFLSALRKNEISGRRDLSIGLSQIILGLRVSEVATLKLEDIDWRKSVLTINGGKSGRVRTLPLPPVLQASLADYVMDERSKAVCSSLFIRCRPPRGSAVSPELVRGIMRRAYSHVDGADNWTGTHLLRRTAATRIHRQGAKLKEVADILGHMSIDTTLVYTKVDIPTLRNVAMPWPTGVSR